MKFQFKVIYETATTYIVWDEQTKQSKHISKEIFYQIEKENKQ